MNKKILILPGDGIGPEVTSSAMEILRFVKDLYSLDLDIETHDVGGAAYDKTGYPLPDKTLEIARKSDAILFGAVGGPEWEDLDWDKRPEQALLGLRKELGLFANLRPAFLFNELASASPIKEEIINDLDILIVRELTGGIYFGKNLANPLAMILSLAMAFRYSLENSEAASIIEKSVKEFISRGFRTKDLTDDSSFLETDEVASELISIIKEKSNV